MADTKEIAPGFHLFYSSSSQNVAIYPSSVTQEARPQFFPTYPVAEGPISQYDLEDIMDAADALEAWNEQGKKPLKSWRDFKCERGLE